MGVNETFTREAVMEGGGWCWWWWKVLSVEIAFVWDVTPCILLETYQCFEEYAALKLESAGSFYKLWYCQTARRHIPKDSKLN